MSTKDSINSDEFDKCTICLEIITNETQNITLECDHIFHKKCLDKLVNKNCPLCRESFGLNIAAPIPHRRPSVVYYIALFWVSVFALAMGLFLIVNLNELIILNSTNYTI